jgi:undecaprenyl-diphosphatase
VTGVEESAFRAVNRLPSVLHIPVWAVMQFGSLASVFVAAAVALRLTAKRTALGLVVTGTIVWAFAKWVKQFVGRSRPEGALDGVTVHGLRQQGLGFPSGHTAVATALAVVAFPATGPRGRAALVGSAASVGLARIYVGAHLPLDVVGGLALGCFAGTTTLLTLNRWASSRDW